MSTQNVKLRDITGSGSTDTITTTYAGEFAGDYIAAALLSGNTLANGGITIKPNVKYQEVIKKLNLSDALTAATCDFTASADKISLVERILSPTELQVNLELCKKDYRSDWEAIQMGISAYDNLPPTFADFLIGQVAAKVAESIENTIWNGEVGGATGYALFDGILHKLADATADIPNGQELTAATITSSNVIDELGKVVDAIPSAVYGKEDLTIYLPTVALQAYVRALGGFASGGQGAAGTNDQGSQWYNMGSGLSFDGIQVVHAPGLSDNDAVAAEKSNLFFGTGLLSDQNEVKVIDMADLDGSQNVRVVMRFTAGIQHGIGSEVVLYATS